MNMEKAIYLATTAEWHKWLELHNSQEREVWLIFYKNGQPNISYEDAVEEALCFGWIDSLIHKIDEERYARKFTPRTNTAKWSPSNKRRVAKLQREGRMTATGLSKLGGSSDFHEDLVVTKPKILEIPPEVEAGLKVSALAWQNFNKLPTSQRRMYILWITSAKRAETVQKRIAESIERLEQGQPLGLK